MSVSAITVALRGARSRSARSPKKPPGSELGDLLAVAVDPGVAVEDHEEVGAGRALGDDRLSGGDVHLLGLLGDELEVLLGERREERDRGEMFDEGVGTGHGRRMYAQFGRSGNGGQPAES